MREIRQSGSEGGAAMSRSYPYRQLFKVVSYSVHTKKRMRHLQFPVRKGGIFRLGAYSLAPRHFRIAQRRAERC
jgi:hypothetical protein